MQYRIMGFLFFCITFFIGCSVSKKIPQYEANWPKLEVGMSKKEVIDILGQSHSKSMPGKIETVADNNLPQMVADMLFEDLLCLRYESWCYGKFGLFENLIFPSDKAYVVYFDKDGNVVSFREPLSYWEKSPYHFKDVSSTQRTGGDFLESIAERAEGPLSPVLETPTPRYPENHAVFCYFPREIVFRWQPARGTPRDVEYLVQIEDTCEGDFEKFGDWTDEPPFFTYRTGKTSMNHRFVGAQPGRWRVKGIDKTGESNWSEWQYFRFTQ